MKPPIPPVVSEAANGYVEYGFAGLAAFLLFMVFKFMTKELNNKMDNQYGIIVKLIDAKNLLIKEIQENNTLLASELNYIKGKLDEKMKKKG